MRRTNWLAGLVVGGCAGLLLGVWPTLGFALLVAFVIPAAISRQRRAAAAGLLVGLAGTWLLLDAIANARCAAFDAAPNQECIAPDVTGWIVVAIGLLAVGLIGSVDLVRRRRPGG
jgi:hypothetical protein